MAYDDCMLCQRLLLVALMSSPATVLAFPEIPFCPLGGPPGWFNRMSGDYRHYPNRPVWYPPPYQQFYQSHPPYPAPAWGPIEQGNIISPNLPAGSNIHQK